MAECELQRGKIMHMHNDDVASNAARAASEPHKSPTEPQLWQTIMERLAGDIDGIVEDFLEELRASDFYQEGRIDAADLRHAAHETFRYLLDRLMGKPMTPHQRNAAQRLGVRRANQGVQIEDLMAAIRLDFIVLWRRIQAMITPKEMPVIINHTEIMLTTIEEYISEVQLEFLAEIARLARDARLATERHLARLLNSQLLTDSSVDLIAQGLQVPVDGKFEVVVIHESAVLEAQDALAEPLAAGRVLGYPYASAYTLFQLSSPSTKPLSQLCSEFAGSYVSEVHGLTEVPSAVSSLYQLLTHREELIGNGATTLVSIEDLWPVALAATLSDLLPAFPGEFIRGLEQLPATEADDVLETIEHFLATGSVKTTAARVDRHRNTVINRLKAFEQATGLDVKVPREAVLATLLAAVAGRQMHN